MQTQSKSISSVFISNIWTGQSWGSPTDERLSLTWTLSLTPSAEYPSAFGATREANPKVLHGTWTPATSVLRLVCASIEIQDDVCTYEGLLREEEDGCYTLSGSFTRAGRLGKFLMRTEPDDAQVHLSGIWVGEAAPDVSLEPFCIPTNPIRWTLSLLTPSSSSSVSAASDAVSVFGAGYFDDAADVPGRPLLFYTLKGAHTTNENIQITKRYDRTAAAEPGAYSIEYTGQLQRDAAGVCALTGRWTNSAAGSFGTFR